MKLHIDNRDGVWNIDYERRPMSKRRFRVVCGLIAAAVYACIAIGITAPSSKVSTKYRPINKNGKRQATTGKNKITPDRTQLPIE